VSKELLELTRRGYEAWNRDDLEWFRDNMAEDVEIHTLTDFFPDADPVYHGPDGWEKFSGIFRESWSSIDVRLERVEDLGGDEVFVEVTFEGVGRESGVAVELTLVHWLSFRDGKLTKLDPMTPEEGERRLAERG
jgi:ketosteroid isomerase-like protein